MNDDNSQKDSEQGRLGRDSARKLAMAVHENYYLNLAKEKAEGALAAIKSSHAWRFLHLFRASLGSWPYFKRLVRLVVRILELKLIARWRRSAALASTSQRAEPATQLHARLLSQGERLPKSNGECFYGKLPIRVGIITDEFMYNFYKDAFTRVHWLTPENASKLIQTDLLLYVTCQRCGANNEWRGRAKSAGLRQQLIGLVAESRQRGNPTVFQSIEDPSNFAHFLPLAVEFGVVLTADADLLEEY